MRVEVRGEMVESGVFRVNRIRVLGPWKFPMHGRCAHCGDRMEAGSPQEAIRPCDECNCHKPAEDCLSD
jgi:hypothetical protein